MGIITMGMIMFDDFFIRALFAGIGLAVIVGPLGCLIIWRKMAFFGDWAGSGFGDWWPQC
jgi:ABC-type Mn2+/Zn2+ transport system permease subunit